MSDRRKLQSEIERCIKKIHEGMSSFEDIVHKLQAAQNSNQRDRCEAEMKKEIKRLQRNREQIKAWISLNEVKDKEPLYDVRRQIETFMEKFKMIEKENKTKSYSKEGLTSSKRDPTRQKRVAFRNWVNDLLVQLSREIEELEAEIETINSYKAKKISKDNTIRIQKLKEKISNHNYHVTNLERLLRLVENEAITVDTAESIKDDLDYYMKCHNDEEGFIHNDTVYDHLDLDSINMTATSATVAATIVPSTSSSNHDSSHSTNAKISGNVRCSPIVETIHEEINPTSVIGEDDQTEQLSVGVNPPEESPKFASHTPQTSMASTEQHSISLKTEPNTISSKKYDKVKVFSNTATLIPTNPPFKLPPVNNTQNNQMASKHDFISTSITTTGGSNSSSSSSVAVTPTHRRNNSAEALYKNINFTSGMKSFKTNTLAGRISHKPTPSEADADFIDSARKSKKNTPYIIKSNAHSSFISHPSSNDWLDCKDVSNDIYNDYINHQLLTTDRRNVGEFDSFNYCNFDSLDDEIFETKHILHNCLTSLPINTPENHNVNTKSLFTSPGFYYNLPNDVLLFIFYHYQGTFSQYMAAKVIKSRNWRFHNILQSWFQRTNEPDLVTAEFEEGGYYFYDFHKWAKKFLEPFRFNFVNLEDKKLL